MKPFEYKNIRDDLDLIQIKMDMLETDEILINEIVDYGSTMNCEFPTARTIQFPFMLIELTYVKIADSIFPYMISVIDHKNNNLVGKVFCYTNPKFYFKNNRYWEPSYYDLETRDFYFSKSTDVTSKSISYSELIQNLDDYPEDFTDMTDEEYAKFILSLDL